MTPQMLDGLTSTSEWTGVPLATLLGEVGASPKATWFLAESRDAAVLARSIPMEKALDDALIVYAQNGEALRPEQGYPVRLFLPGFEGSASVKWLRRIELATEPFMTREETSKYTDPLPDGTARQFSFVMDAKSIITEPAFPEKRRGAGLARDPRHRLDRTRQDQPRWTSASTAAPPGRGRRSTTRCCPSATRGSAWRGTGPAPRR